MLFGQRVHLRPVRESDLDALYDAHVDVRNRGPYFPLGVKSEPAFKRSFAETGFDNKKFNRIHLMILPENGASRRIAEKCGFQLEGTVRGAMFSAGRNVDLMMFSLLRSDPRPWHASEPTETS